jgi:hypothetical protein
MDVIGIGGKGGRPLPQLHKGMRRVHEDPRERDGWMYKKIN